MEQPETKTESPAETAADVIIIRNLHAGYDGEPILEDINLSIRELDFIGLVGPNGGGKTTLLKILVGLMAPTRGEVRIAGQPVRTGRKWVGYVPQSMEFDRQFPLRVRDVVRMGRLAQRRHLRPYTSEDDGKVEEALRCMNIEDLLDKPVGALSGGERQRVFIARALAGEPRILLLDEPTASVDPGARGSLYDLLAKLNERVTILLVTHDLGVISSYVKTVGCLNRKLHYHGGKDLTQSVLEEVYQCPVDLIAHGVPHRVFPEHG